MSTSERVPCAIIGSGNIGTDLMLKLLRSPLLLPVSMVGIDPESEGLALARKKGLTTSYEGIHFLLRQAKPTRIVFEATTAAAHLRHAPLLQEAGISCVDLTPAAVGPSVVPSVNLDQHLDVSNHNLTTCGGQATVPIVAALSRIVPVRYAEIVSTIASLSAGPGTRQNIDEFTRTTAHALETIGEARAGKAIIILNPAEPPIIMRNTVYALVDDWKPREICQSVENMVKSVQEYVPGYRMRAEPIMDAQEKMVTVLLEVEGAGDFLPRFAGNLDIMTSAAIRVAERIAVRMAGSVSENHLEDP